MPYIILVVKIIFAVSYVVALSIMANYFFKKAYGNSFYNLCGVLTTIGIILLIFLRLARLYEMVIDTGSVTLFLTGAGKFMFLLFLVLLSVISFYLYVLKFKKSKYQIQQNIVLVLAFISIALLMLPHNAYTKDEPGMLLPVLRMIPSVVLGGYVSLICFLDGYYKRSKEFQLYGIYLSIIQLMHLIYAFYYKGGITGEYFVFVITCICFILMIGMFSKELHKKHALEKF